MGEVFYAEYTKQFQPHNQTAWGSSHFLVHFSFSLNYHVDDIENQFQLMFDHTVQDPGSANYSGLLYHGYDYSHTAVWASTDRGHSPEIWSRAVGKCIILY